MLYKRTKKGNINLISLQVDDSFGAGTAEFLEEEKYHSKEFQSKPRKVFKVGTRRNFNGSVVTRITKDSYFISQADKLKSLANTDDSTFKYQLQYIASCSRPDLLSCAQLLDHHNKKDVNKLRKYVEKTTDL